MRARSEPIKANLQRTGLAERATVTRGEVLAWLRDPARAHGIPRATWPSSTHRTRTRRRSPPPWTPSGRCSTPNARVVAKHFWRDAPPARVGLLASDRERRFGETTLTFYRPVGDITEDA